MNTSMLHSSSSTMMMTMQRSCNTSRTLHMPSVQRAHVVAARLPAPVSPLRTVGNVSQRQRGGRDVRVFGLFGLGLPEIAVIAGVAALIWGPSKLPELGKTMGKAVKGFQTAASEFNDELKKATAEDAQGDKPAASASPAAPADKPKQEQQ